MIHYVVELSSYLSFRCFQVIPVEFHAYTQAYTLVVRYGPPSPSTKLEEERNPLYPVWSLNGPTDSLSTYAGLTPGAPSG